MITWSSLTSASYRAIGMQTLELWPKVASRLYSRMNNIDLSTTATQGSDNAADTTNEDVTAGADDAAAGADTTAGAGDGCFEAGTPSEQVNPSTSVVSSEIATTEGELWANLSDLIRK